MDTLGLSLAIFVGLELGLDDGAAVGFELLLGNIDPVNEGDDVVVGSVEGESVGAVLLEGK